MHIPASKPIDLFVAIKISNRQLVIVVADLLTSFLILK